MKKTKKIVITTILLIAVIMVIGRTFDDEPKHSHEVIIHTEYGEYARLPFGVETEVAIEQKGMRNVVAITEDEVFMKEANCDNQRCLHAASGFYRSSRRGVV